MYSMKYTFINVSLVGDARNNAIRGNWPGIKPQFTPSGRKAVQAPIPNNNAAPTTNEKKGHSSVKTRPFSSTVYSHRPLLPGRKFSQAGFPSNSLSIGKEDA
jgi:hypothetical protein